MRTLDTKRVRHRLQELQAQCLSLGLKAAIEGEDPASYGPKLNRRARAIHRLNNILAGRPVFG